MHGVGVDLYASQKIMMGLTRRVVLHPAKTGTAHAGRAWRLYEICSETAEVMSKATAAYMRIVLNSKINLPPFWSSL
ncbi:hypothetical protein EMIT0P218_50259 [Pseudomonas sp. IT-P218]